MDETLDPFIAAGTLGPCHGVKERSLGHNAHFPRSSIRFPVWMYCPCVVFFIHTIIKSHATTGPLCERTMIGWIGKSNVRISPSTTVFPVRDATADAGTRGGSGGRGKGRGGRGGGGEGSESESVRTLWDSLADYSRLKRYFVIHCFFFLFFCTLFLFSFSSFSHLLPLLFLLLVRFLVVVVVVVAVVVVLLLLLLLLLLLFFFFFFFFFFSSSSSSSSLQSLSSACSSSSPSQPPTV